MKIFTTLIMCLFSFASLAQKIPDLGLNKFRITYADKTVQAEILPVTSAPLLQTDRYYYWYSANQIRTTQGGFSGRLLNGLYSEFYLNRNLKEQGAFKKGLKIGVWKQWSDNGTLLQIQEWEDGLKEGICRLYGLDGKLIEEGGYRNGLLQGTYKTYRGKDSIGIQRYDKGILLPAKKPSVFWKKLKIWNRNSSPYLLESLDLERPDKATRTDNRSN